MQVGSVGNTSLSQGTDNAPLRAVRGAMLSPAHHHIDLPAAVPEQTSGSCHSRTVVLPPYRWELGGIGLDVVRDIGIIRSGASRLRLQRRASLAGRARYSLA